MGKKVPSTGTGNNDQANDQNQVRSDKDSLKEEKENQGEAGQGQGGQGGEDGSPASGGQHAPSPFSMLQAKLEQLPRGPPMFPGPPGFLGSHGMDNPLQMMASITNSLVSQPLPSPSMAAMKM